MKFLSATSSAFCRFCLVAVLLFSLSSCRKKCRVCECEKDGLVYTEKNCAYGSAGIKNLETWERYLKEEKGYEKVTCSDD